MHIHTLKVDLDADIEGHCTGCDLALRLATRDETYFIDMTDGFEEDGPIIGPTGLIYVPVDYSLFEEA